MQGRCFKIRPPLTWPRNSSWDKQMLRARKTLQPSKNT